jgi:hypothetical protein
MTGRIGQTAFRSPTIALSYTELTAPTPAIRGQEKSLFPSGADPLTLEKRVGHLGRKAHANLRNLLRPGTPCHPFAPLIAPQAPNAHTLRVMFS